MPSEFARRLVPALQWLMLVAGALVAAREWAPAHPVSPLAVGALLAALGLVVLARGPVAAALAILASVAGLGTVHVLLVLAGRHLGGGEAVAFTATAALAATGVFLVCVTVQAASRRLLTGALCLPSLAAMFAIAAQAHYGSLASPAIAPTLLGFASAIFAMLMLDEATGSGRP